MKSRLLFFLVVMLLILNRGTAQQYTLNITDVQLREIYVKGFVLHQDRAVHIKAVGAGMKMKIKRRRSPVCFPEMKILMNFRTNGEFW